MRNVFIIFFVLLIFFSCKKNRVLNNYKNFSNHEWHTDSLVFFSFVIEDSLSTYSLTAKVSHSVNYQYQNLFLFIYSEFSRDTIELVLAEKNGKWKGKGIGDLRELQYTFNNKKVFQKKGVYKYTFEQAMRYGSKPKITVLRDIESVGLSILKNANKN